MKRRLFLTESAAAGLALSGRTGWGGSRAKDSVRHPNILFVFADQLRADALSCYGDPNIKTPNLDRLAAEGALFNHAISTFPVCSPYRAQLLYGKYPFRSGVISNNRIPFAGQETFGRYTKRAGYVNGYIGKWDVWPRNFIYVPKEARPGFEEYFMSYNCTHSTHMNGFYFDTDGSKICFPGSRHASPYEPTAQTDLAVEFIERHANGENPFCLFVSWGPPHEPRDLIPEDQKVTDPLKLILRENVNERAMVDELLAFDPGYQYNPVREPVDKKTVHSRTKDRRWLDSEQSIREDTALYYDNILALDREMGRLMESLDRSGIRENTLVVFTSDHGDMLGSHRMGHKQMPFEESIRIPFLIRYPERIEAGQVTDALLAPVDLIPTLFSLAGIPVPMLDGKDMSPAVLGASVQQEGLLIGTILSGGNPLHSNALRPWRGVRTERYTYAKFLEPEEKGWLLFDNRNDPQQMNNLMDDENHSAVKEYLDALTERLRKENSEQTGQEQTRAQIAAIHNNAFQNTEKRRYFSDGQGPAPVTREKAQGMECL